MLVWATYVGGSGAEGNGYSHGSGISVDAAGNAVVTGWTTSLDFSGANNSHKERTYGVYDAFVAKISPSGSLVWATYLGGSDDDYGEGISVDSAGNAFVTGLTSSADFSGADNAYHGGSDAFVVKLSPSGLLTWTTYVGGSGGDWGRGISVDAAGNAFATGSTWSTDFSGANNAFPRLGRGICSNAPRASPPFEVLARGVAYENSWHKSDPPQAVIFDGIPLNYVVDAVFQDGTGFYALGLLSGLYGPALVIRGTEPTAITDWWADTDPWGVGYGQFTAAKQDGVLDWAECARVGGHRGP